MPLAVPRRKVPPLLPLLALVSLLLPAAPSAAGCRRSQYQRPKEQR